MKTFFEFLTEAVPFALYRQTMRDVHGKQRHDPLHNFSGQSQTISPDQVEWDHTFLEKAFKASPLKKDKGAFRLYLPLTAGSGGSSQTETYAAIDEVLASNGYMIIDYYNSGTARKIDRHKHESIGSVLANIARKSPDAAYINRLLTAYSIDKQRGNNTDTAVIIISRHPLDIMGQSTGREVSNCQELNTGRYCHYVHKDIRAGTLIAYLVNRSQLRADLGMGGQQKQGDPINDFIAFILIKPYINDKGETAFAASVKGYPAEKVDKFFKDRVNQWVAEFNKSLGVKGFFRIKDGVYIGADGKVSEVDRTEFTIDDDGEIEDYRKDEVNPSYTTGIAQKPFDPVNDPISVVRSGIYDYDDFFKAIMTATKTAMSTMSHRNPNKQYIFEFLSSVKKRILNENPNDMQDFIDEVVFHTNEYEKLEIAASVLGREVLELAFSTWGLDKLNYVFKIVDVGKKDFSPYAEKLRIANSEILDKLQKWGPIFASVDRNKFYSLNVVNDPRYQNLF
jgi:hypothetical protein